MNKELKDTLQTVRQGTRELSIKVWNEIVCEGAVTATYHLTTDMQVAWDFAIRLGYETIELFYGNNICSVFLTCPIYGTHYVGYGYTPALALCAALIQDKKKVPTL